MATSFLTTLVKWFSLTDSQAPKPPLADPSSLSFIDERAIVITLIQPGQRGRVLFQATEWFAICPYYVVLMSDTPVRVIGRNGTTLIIEPLPLIMSGSWFPLHAA